MNINRFVTDVKTADLLKLPDGLRFWVTNGNWEGRIETKDNTKCIRILDGTSENLNERPIGQLIPITELNNKHIDIKYVEHNVLFLYIYSNMTMTYNVVAFDDIDNHIEYNRTWRPGRLMYCEEPDYGFIRLNDGCIKEEYLDEYDKIAKEFFEKHDRSESDDISRFNITRPYR